MKKGKTKGFDLQGKLVSSDPAMARVIASQAKSAELKRFMKCIEKDRDQLLEEYTDMINARPVPKSPSKVRKAGKIDTVRVNVGDMHGMRMDRAAVDTFLADMKDLDPDEIVLGGDMMECGGWLARHLPVGFVALSDYTYQEDVNATNWFLDELQKVCPHAVIHYLEGNHESRVERWCVDQTMAHKRDATFLREAFAPQYLLRLKERGIKYYCRSEIYVDGLPRGWIKLGKMCFTHQLAGGKNAASRSLDRSSCNLTFFHTHKEDTATRVLPTIGLVKAFCPGCLCVMQPVWQHSLPTDWSQGYDINFIAKSGNFQRLNVPIWRGTSLAGAMIKRFRS